MDAEGRQDVFPKVNPDPAAVFVGQPSSRPPWRRHRCSVIRRSSSALNLSPVIRLDGCHPQLKLGLSTDRLHTAAESVPPPPPPPVQPSMLSRTVS